LLTRFPNAHISPSALAAATGVALILSVVYIMAWWTVRRSKPSARYWIILPSLFQLSSVVFVAFRSPSHLGGTLIPLVIGLGGPIYTWRPGFLKASPKATTIPKIAGDGTSDMLNRAGMALSTIAYIGAFALCGFWVHANLLPRVYSGILLLIVIGFFSTLVHELGHTVFALAFHMRLRAFSAGPFLWRIREGKWTFKFNLMGLLSEGGFMGAVPTSAQSPEWHEIFMIAAGPITNFYFGCIALALAEAFATADSAYRNFAYPCALFAIYNLLSFATNLIPLRSATGYSDGAQLVQLFRGGSWAAYHRATSLVSSGLVTPLQPKDYDLDTIQRAAEGIREGRQGMLLRLYAFYHLLHTDRIPEAVQALQEAEQVANSSVHDLPAEMHTVFVFGNAYARHDAAAARQWWERMMAKKPTHLNTDYYRAESALYWIEGQLDMANASWVKSNQLALALPAAGAYEFDRICCTLLRQAIDKDPGGKLPIVHAHVPAPAIPLINGVPCRNESGYEYTFLKEAVPLQRQASGIPE
jgi:hypothetical protein